jgi:hypothetical protein
MVRDGENQSDPHGEQACRCPTSAWPKLSDTGGVQPGRRCRHHDRLAPSALECWRRRMPLGALQQSVFGLTQCSIIKRGLAAYRLPRNVRATRALHGSRQRIGDSRAVAGGGQRGAKLCPGSGAACAPRPMARSVLAFEGEGVGADEVGFGSAPPAGVEGVDCVDLCRSQFGLKTSEVSAMRRGRTDFGIAPPMIGAAMPGNRAPPRGAGRCAARKQSTRGYASNGPCAPVPTSPNQVRSGG